MINSVKKYKALESVLNEGDPILISEAIVFLREEIPFEGAIGLLTAFYDKTFDNSIKKTIEGFMNDVKDISVKPEVINEIRKQWKNDTISMLVASCWQSGLDYSEYTSDLAGLFLRGDYVTSIECMTVIEESAAILSSEEKGEIIKVINDNPLSGGNEKKALTVELISILSR
jgi:hypothetical protein